LKKCATRGEGGQVAPLVQGYGLLSSLTGAGAGARFTGAALGTAGRELTPDAAQGNVKGMELTVQIPDDLATSMSASGGDLARRALEALALEEFKSGHLTKPELRRLLGFGTRYRLDGFLKSHGVYEDYTMEDFDSDRDALKQLGF